MPCEQKYSSSLFHTHIFRTLLLALLLFSPSLYLYAFLCVLSTYIFCTQLERRRDGWLETLHTRMSSLHFWRLSVIVPRKKSARKLHVKLVSLFGGQNVALRYNTIQLKKRTLLGGLVV